MAIVTSILTGGVNNHTTSSEEANAIYTDFVSQGVQGTVTNTTGVAPATGSFAVNAQGTPDATVAVSAGVAYVTGTPTSQNSQKFRVKNSASTNVTISANSSGSTKYDWIYVKLDATNLNAPNTAGDNVATVVASRSSSASSDDGTPPTYGIAIAVVTVANGFSTITNSNIRDVRTQSTVTATAGTTSQDWYALGYTPSTVTANGNRSYSLTITNTDLTSTISVGQRLKTTRTVAAPTQCADLEASSSQYFNDTSVSGMTFTDDFVVSAWVKLESYAQMYIASRYNGTSGWGLSVESTGQIRLVGFNASAANFSYVLSSQSIPLGRWVHVAAQLDMSAFTATTTTSYVMIDGVDVPASVTRAGTNPTALIQAGNLEIGSTNGGGIYFDGKIAQVAIYSAKVTQANVKATISQGLSGSETSLVSAYSFNNSINDLNANANNLTAQGGALATNADSPFAQGHQGVPTGTTDYAIITKTAFSTDTTLTVQVPEGCTIPTSGGVSAVAYSSAKVPFGFPAESGRWRVASIYQSRGTKTTQVNGTIYYNGEQLTIPLGNWIVGYNINVYGGTTTAQDMNIKTDLNTSTPSGTLPTSTGTSLSVTSEFSGVGGSANAVFHISAKSQEASSLVLSSATTYYFVAQHSFSGTGSSLLWLHDFSRGIIYADLAYL